MTTTTTTTLPAVEARGFVEAARQAIADGPARFLHIEEQTRHGGGVVFLWIAATGDGEWAYGTYTARDGVDVHGDGNLPIYLDVEWLAEVLDSPYVDGRTLLDW